LKKNWMSLAIAAGVLFSSSDLAHASSIGDNIINTGDNYLGKPYRLGSAFGNTSSFDCSSFTSYVFARNGITLPRTSVGQAGAGIPVSKNDLQIGDLLFYDTDYDRVINHVGIYAGNGKMLNAQSSNGVAFTDAFSSYYWGARFVTARRVIKEEGAATVASPTAATPKPTAAAASKTVKHKVQRGETLWGISKKYKTSIANIQKWNGLKSPSIRAGQTLTVSGQAPKAVKAAVKPAKKTAKKSTSKRKTYTVKSGDSLWKIAKSNRMSVKQLMSFNKLKSANIYPGQKITLRS
jgi:LysM repeat protein